ncbi:rCG59857, isoform CRA_a [Rattus norvegicus]|uniref:RCG59857, isoform CRA_a n=1 Tax=Rattus norvegicus TaxID=10116 RepID=A6HSY7_RAT|nr:rCG59857, isoform CRA_a [Rattus norvegicus]EDM15735.1 rCG59857, isoform CRA_a [Rattus norvegicus]
MKTKPLKICSASLMMRQRRLIHACLSRFHLREGEDEEEEGERQSRCKGVENWIPCVPLIRM